MTTPAIQSHEGMITVRTTAFSQESEEQRTIDVRPFITTPATVTVKRGQTINLGNYESARLDVAIQMPCYREEILPVYRTLMAEVDKILAEEVTKLGTAFGIGVQTSATPSIEELL